MTGEPSTTDPQKQLFSRSVVKTSITDLPGNKKAILDGHASNRRHPYVVTGSVIGGALGISIIALVVIMRRRQLFRRNDTRGKSGSREASHSYGQQAVALSKLQAKSKNIYESVKRPSQENADVVVENGLSSSSSQETYKESHENQGFVNTEDDSTFQSENIVYEELQVSQTTANPLYTAATKGDNTDCNTSAEDIVILVTDNLTYEPAGEKIAVSDNPIYQSCEEKIDASEIRTRSCYKETGNNYLYACCDEKDECNINDKSHMRQELATTPIYDELGSCCQDAKESSEVDSRERQENHFYDEAEIGFDKNEETGTNSHIYDDPESMISNSLHREDSQKSDSNNVDIENMYESAEVVTA